MKFSARLSSATRQKRVIARAIAGGLLLVLPSCQIPKLRPAEPGPGVPTEFTIATGSENSSALAAVVGGFGIATIPNATTSPDGAAGSYGTTGSENSSQLRVEEFYNDSTLTQLIYQGLAGNRELKALDEEIQIARSEVLARQGAYLPFVTFGASAGMDKSSRFTRDGAVDSALDIRPGQPIHNPMFNFMGAFNFLWTPDIWRALRNARDAAAQRYIATSEKRNSFVTTLIAEVAENYYKLMALDQRIVMLDKTIDLQQQSLEFAIAKFESGLKGNSDLPVKRFRAEVRKNQSEKLIVKQEIVEAENRINFLANRYPQPVERPTAGFYDLNIPLNVGLPIQLLQNRPDIRQAERELVAAGFDVKIARAHFFPAGSIGAGIGFAAFNPKYLFYPEALIANAVGELVTPVINKKAIQAEFIGANAKQLESVYNYQRVVLNAFTEVTNRVSMAENYRKSIEIKKQQLVSLEGSVESATSLFKAGRAEYIEVLFAQRDLLEARTVLIQTKQQQLSAIVNTYQALGGGGSLLPLPPMPPPPPHSHRSLFKGPFWSQIR